MTMTKKRKAGPARYQFDAFMRQAEKLGWVIPEHRETCYALLAAIVGGDDVAALALADLYRECGKEGRAERIPDMVKHFNLCVAGWSTQQKAAFFRLCKIHGVYVK